MSEKIKITKQEIWKAQKEMARWPSADDMMIIERLIEEGYSLKEVIKHWKNEVEVAKMLD